MGIPKKIHHRKNRSKPILCNLFYHPAFSKVSPCKGDIILHLIPRKSMVSLLTGWLLPGFQLRAGCDRCACSRPPSFLFENIHLSDNESPDRPRASSHGSIDPLLFKQVLQFLSTNERSTFCVGLS